MGTYIQIHQVSKVQAKFGCGSKTNNWVTLILNDETELTLFFDERRAEAEAYAAAINSVRAKLPCKVDEQEAA